MRLATVQASKSYFFNRSARDRCKATFAISHASKIADFISRVNFFARTVDCNAKKKNKNLLFAICSIKTGINYIHIQSELRVAILDERFHPSTFYPRSSDVVSAQKCDVVLRLKSFRITGISMYSAK